MESDLKDLALELGKWPRNKKEAKEMLKGTCWFYQPKTGAVKSNRSRRVIHKPEWRSERERLERMSTT